MFKSTKKKSETRRWFDAARLDASNRSLSKCFRVKNRVNTSDRAFIERIFTTLSNEPLEQRVPKCPKR